MPITTLSKKTNSLQSKGDFMTIRTELPIEPSLTKVLGFYVTTNDVIDNQEEIGVYYYILPVTRLNEISDSDINENWIFVDKSDDSSYNSFINNCNSTIESYYLWFKIEKTVSINKFLTIDKLSLQLQNIKELQENYENYNNSIFRDKKMYSEDTLRWSYNVLEKIDATGSILPTYIHKDKDFITFWGSITHFFAIIVNYGRQFRDFLSNENLFGLYMEQKDYYRDNRSGVFSDIILNSNQKLTYTVKENCRMSSSGEIIGVSGYSCSSLIPIRENNYIYLSLDNFNQRLLYKPQNQIYKGIANPTRTLIYKTYIQSVNKIYFRVLVDGDDAQIEIVNNSTYSFYGTVKSYSYKEISVTDGEVNVYITSVKGCNYEIVQLKDKEEFIKDQTIHNQIKSIFGNKEYEVDICFFNDKKEFIVQNLVLLSKTKLDSWFYIEQRQNISYVAFSYNLPNQIIVKLTAYGEGDIAIKNYEVRDLLNVYPIFKNRGTIHTNNAIKKLCETKPSDTFFSDYLNIKNSCCILDGGNGFTEHFRESLILSEFIPSRITPLYNGELLEFNQNFVYYTNNNSIKIKFEYDALNDYNAGSTFKILLYINLYSNDYTEFKNNLLAKSTPVKFIEIDDIPNTINELIIPISCIRNSNYSSINQNLIKLNYLKDIYLFCKQDYNTKIELKYLQLKSIFVYPTDMGINTTYLIGYRLVQINNNKSLVRETVQSLTLQSLNTSTRKVKFTLVYTGTDYSQQTQTITKNIEVEYLPSDVLGEYIKVYLNEEIVKGLFILNNNSFTNINQSIPLSTSIKRVFSSGDNDINSFEAIAEFMDNNVASDWGDAFSYYYKPYVDFGHSTNVSLSEYTTKDSGGSIYTGLNKYKFRRINCYYCIRKIDYGFNFLDIRDYYLINYRNNGQFTNKKFEEIVNQKFLPYRGFKIFENVAKDNLIYVSPLKFLQEKIIISNNINYTLNWTGGYPPYTVKQYSREVDSIYPDFPSSSVSTNLTSRNFNLQRNIFYKLVVQDNLGTEIIKLDIFYSPIEAIGYNTKLNILSGNATEISNKNSKKIYDDLYICPVGGISPYELRYKDKNNRNKSVWTTAKHFALLKDFPFLRNHENKVTIVDSLGNQKEIDIRYNKFYSALDLLDGGSCILK